MDVPADLVARLGPIDATYVTQTAIARVWRVTWSGKDAALKVYVGRDMRNEAHGFDLLSALDRQGAAQIYAVGPGYAVLEWLDGPSLGDLTRDGRDTAAAQALAQVAVQLHAHPVTVIGLPNLEDWCADLFTARFAPTCSPDLRQDIIIAQNLSRTLLADPRDVRPLHGDLHHDNVRRGPRGWCAFDAKGVLGERTFELANALRNPTGANALIRDPARFAACVDLWSRNFDLDPARLRAWAAVKCALSIVWRADGPVAQDDEADLLSQFLAYARAD